MVYRGNAVRYEDTDWFYIKSAPTKKYYNRHVVKRAKHKKNLFISIISRVAALLLLTALGVLLMPVSYKIFMRTFFPKTISAVTYQNSVCAKAFIPQCGIDYYEFMHPSLSYLTNYTFFNTRIAYDVPAKKFQMSALKYGDRLTELESELKKLNKKYSNITPAIFVWSMDNYNYADICGSKIYPAASIIKLPILIQLYKSIESEKFGLNDHMYLAEYYRSAGSGMLQYARRGKSYSIYNLAKHMIQDSDNTATNMLISKIGSMNNINAALKNWGINHTRLQTWLPDLTGTNYTTAKDMAQILYNIGNDDNEFLNINSQSDIINIMGKVKNTSLIKAGLPKNVDFIHKTGDIGTMLGDAGIVYLPSGQRYIAVILAQRPYNHQNGKLFIQEASRIIYNYMSAKN